MAFFEQIQDIAKSVAEKTESIAKNVSEKAEAALEIQKLSSEIAKEKNNIQQAYNCIGEKIYTSYIDADMEVPEFLEENFHAINTSLEKIEILNQKISEIKLSKLSINLPKVTCPKCGSEILANAKFCPECGEKVAKTVKQEPVIEPEVIDAEKPAVQTAVYAEEAAIITETAQENKADKPAEEKKTE